VEILPHIATHVAVRDRGGRVGSNPATQDFYNWIWLVNLRAWAANGVSVQAASGPAYINAPDEGITHPKWKTHSAEEPLPGNNWLPGGPIIFNWEIPWLKL
jgi:hypothetical protein